MRWAASIPLTVALVCGIGEYVASDRLKLVPCRTNHIVEWKGMTKCVPKFDAMLWHSLDYGLKAALLLAFASVLISNFSGSRKK